MIAGILAVLPLISSQALASPKQVSKDLTSYLRNPEVRYLAVETTGPDCAQCGAQASTWKSLNDKYGQHGLRVLTVVQPNASGTCAQVAWKPSWVVCDKNGYYAQALGIQKPGEAFLWNWWGQLLAKATTVDQLESQIQGALKTNLRIAVEGKDGRSRPAPKLVERSRAIFATINKFSIVPRAQERATLQRIQQKWFKSMMGGKGNTCELGNAANPDHVARLKVLGLRRKKSIKLTLLSGKANCTLGKSAKNIEYKPKDDEQSAEAIKKTYLTLLDAIRFQIEMPVELKVVSAAKGKSEMVTIASGTFTMGCIEEKDPSCMRHESPSREVKLASFAIDRVEVSVGEYEKCTQAKKCVVQAAMTMSPSCNWGKEGRKSHPMNCVSWNEAQNFCKWKGKRLPYETEWERVARGKTDRIYPWGDERPTCERAIMDDENEGGIACGRGSTTWPVGSRALGATKDGVLDLSGNVSEWVYDWYGDKYYESKNQRPEGPKSGIMKVFRGGGYYNRTTDLRVSYRDRSKPTMRNGSLGFRCVKSLTETSKK